MRRPSHWFLLRFLLAFPSFPQIFSKQNIYLEHEKGKIWFFQFCLYIDLLCLPQIFENILTTLYVHVLCWVLPSPPPTSQNLYFSIASKDFLSNLISLKRRIYKLPVSSSNITTMGQVKFNLYGFRTSFRQLNSLLDSFWILNVS